MSNMIKLSEWAAKHGINYQTAYRWYKADKLPAKNIIKTPTGTILVEELVPEYDTTSETIFTDESQPLNRRLIHAYRFIQANQKDTKDDHKDHLEEFTKQKQEDVPCDEKEKLLKEMRLLKENPFFSEDNTLLELGNIRSELIKNGQVDSSVFKAIELLIKEKKDKLEKEGITEAIKKDIIKLSEDYDLLQEDHDKLMKEIYGDINNGTLYPRIKSRLIHLTFKSIEGLLENAESFDDLKKNYKKFKEAFYNQKWEE